MILFRAIAALLFSTALTASAAIDVAPLQRQLEQGRAEEVRQFFDQALQTDSANLHLLYNRAVAACASGRYEEALVDLDRVEIARNKNLAAKARFQKGNAEFHLGLPTQATDPEATIARWKQSLASYTELMRDQPTHASARTNFTVVRKALFDLLLKTAQENLQKGKLLEQPADQKIQELRGAMEQFHEAGQLEKDSEPAKVGETEARDLLAKALAEEGTRKTLTTAMVVPTARNEPQIPRPDTAQIEEGVNMLEDAQSLKPQDKSIAEQLSQGRDRFASALTMQARIYQSIEPHFPRIDEKLGLLRMAMELVERALEKSPNHQLAKQTLEELKKRLAEIHEQQGDQLSQIPENAPMDQQAQDLSEALDHFQQATDLQPQQTQLPQKAKQTQNRLEDVLEKLGDQLMKEPGEQESLDAEAMRLEGAVQALTELQSLKPSDKTLQKAQQASEKLAGVRQKLGARGQPKQAQQGNQGQQQPGMQPPRNQQGTPMDAPPKLNTKGSKGQYRSPAMSRNLRDY